MQQATNASLPYKFLLAQYVSPLVVVTALFSAQLVQGHDYSFRWHLFSLFLLLAAGAGRLFTSYKKALPLPKGPVVVFFTLFVVWAGFSIFWSPAAGASLLKLTTFLAGLVSIYIGFWWRDRQYELFKWLLMLMAIYLVALTVYQSFVLDISRPSGHLLNYNTHAAMIGMILLPFCADYIRETRPGKNWLFGFFCMAGAFAMSLTQSRGAFLALFVGLCLLYAAAIFKNYPFSKLIKLGIWVISGMVLGSILQQSSSLDRVIAFATLGDTSSIAGGRRYLWDAAWRMYLDRPWMGWGLNTYYQLFPRYKAPMHVEAGQFAHNDYLQFLMELGPVGLFLSIGIVAAVLQMAWKTLFQTGKGENSLSAAGLQGACLGMLAHTAFSFNLYHLPIQILFGLYLGRSVCSLAGQSKKKTEWVPENTMTASGYYSILSVSALLITVWISTVAIGFFQVKKSNEATSIIEKFTSLDTAAHLLPYLEEYQSRQGYLVLTLLKHDRDILTDSERRSLFEYGLSLTDKAITNNPLNPLNYMNKAKLLELNLNGRVNIDEVDSNYRQALQLNPYRLDNRSAYVRFLVDQKRERQALKLMEEGLGKGYFDRYDNGIEFLNQLYMISEKLGANQNLSIIKKNRELLELIKQKDKSVRAGWSFALRTDTDEIAKAIERLKKQV